MMFFLFIKDYSNTSNIILGFLFAILFYMMLHYGFKMYEMAYVMRKKKPLYRHGLGVRRKLSVNQVQILKNDFSFYCPYLATN